VSPHTALTTFAAAYRGINQALNLQGRVSSIRSAAGSTLQFIPQFFEYFFICDIKDLPEPIKEAIFSWQVHTESSGDPTANVE
jgi:hypothetical protein